MNHKNYRGKYDLEYGNTKQFFKIKIFWNDTITLDGSITG